MSHSLDTMIQMICHEHNTTERTLFDQKCPRFQVKISQMLCGRVERGPEFQPSIVSRFHATTLREVPDLR